MAKVIRLYGKADELNIEFSRNGDKWEADVPPDMTDGVYACQLTAIDELGELAYWVGELYMVNGVCCLKISELPYRVQIKPKEYEVAFHKRKCDVFCCSSFNIDFGEKIIAQVEKNKCSKPNYIVEFSTTLHTSEFTIRGVSTVNTKKTEKNIKTDFDIEITPKTKIFIRKGCHCYGGK